MLTLRNFMAFLFCSLCIHSAVEATNASLVFVAKADQMSTVTNFSPPDTSRIKEYGLLEQVEDSGYPFYTLTISFPERGFKEYFSLNLEDVKSIDSKDLSDAVGKYMSFEYTSQINNMLLDLKLDGKSLIHNGKGFQPDSDTKTITGILSNAAEATTGDIPGELYVKTEEEITETFPFFITPKIVKANGKTVSAYYQQRTQNTVKFLEIHP